MKTRWWYHVLKTYVQLGLGLFFKKWQIEGVHLLPEGKPLILVCNHQNAFLDALLVLSSLRKSPWFFARSDAFRNPKAAAWLHDLKMLPIYRFRDGGISVLKGNQDSFAEAIGLLKEGERILIFGEGNHGEDWQLRPLQRGFARLAMRAMQEHPELDLQIVPVGLQYEKRNEVYSEVLVNFGEPIAAANYLSDPEAKAIRKLSADLRKRMECLIVHIPEAQYEERHRALQRVRSRPKDLIRRLREDQQWVQRMEAGEALPPAHLQTQKARGIFQSLLRGYAYFNHALFRRIYQSLVQKTRDDQFKLSLEFVAFLFIYPVILLIQSGLILLLTDNFIVAIVYLISLPLSASLYLNTLR
jgi:1-acyl-sn-glycerol-3-phosphate acyltransferase